MGKVFHTLPLECTLVILVGVSFPITEGDERLLRTGCWGHVTRRHRRGWMGTCHDVWVTGCHGARVTGCHGARVTGCRGYGRGHLEPLLKKQVELVLV